MKNKKLLAVLAVTISASVFMAGCGFGEERAGSSEGCQRNTGAGGDKGSNSYTYHCPNVQDTTYTSADKSVSINLPDATWQTKLTRQIPSALSLRTMAISLFFTAREKRQWLPL